MAPEVLSKNKYSEKADVYSFGIVLAEIFTGALPYSEPPFDKMNQAQLMYQILEQGARPNIESLNISLQQLIRDCWNTDPRLRPSFAEAVVRLRRLKAERVPEDLQEADQGLDIPRHDSFYGTGTSSEYYSFTDDMNANETKRDKEVSIAEEDPVIEIDPEHDTDFPSERNPLIN